MRVSIEIERPNTATDPRSQRAVCNAVAALVKDVADRIMNCGALQNCQFDRGEMTARVTMQGE